MPRTESVSVVIPSNSAALVPESLVKSLLTDNQSVREVIISHSGPLEKRICLERAVMIHSDQPLLASAARNRGARIATGDVLFFLDDDNECAPGFVDILADALETTGHLAVVGPAMYYASDRTRPYAFGALHGNVLRPTTWILDSNRAHHGLVYADALPNAFMLRRAHFEAVEGFDESQFRMDFEESDLQLRVQERFNKQLACVLDAKVWHDANVDKRVRMSPKSTSRAFTIGRNRTVFIARHYRRWWWMIWILGGLWLFAVAMSIAILSSPATRMSVRTRNCFYFLAGVFTGIPQSFSELAHRRARPLPSRVVPE